MCHRFCRPHGSGGGLGGLEHHCHRKLHRRPLHPRAANDHTGHPHSDHPPTTARGGRVQLQHGDEGSGNAEQQFPRDPVQICCHEPGHSERRHAAGSCGASKFSMHSTAAVTPLPTAAASFRWRRRAALRTNRVRNVWTVLMQYSDIHNVIASSSTSSASNRIARRIASISPASLPPPSSRASPHHRHVYALCACDGVMPSSKTRHSPSLLSCFNVMFRFRSVESCLNLTLP